MQNEIKQKLTNSLRKYIFTTTLSTLVERTSTRRILSGIKNKIMGLIIIIS